MWEPKSSTKTCAFLPLNRTRGAPRASARASRGDEALSGVARGTSAKRPSSSLSCFFFSLFSPLMLYARVRSLPLLASSHPLFSPPHSLSTSLISTGSYVGDFDLQLERVNVYVERRSDSQESETFFSFVHCLRSPLLCFLLTLSHLSFLSSPAPNELSLSRSLYAKKTHITTATSTRRPVGATCPAPCSWTSVRELERRKRRKERADERGGAAMLFLFFSKLSLSLSCCR